MRGLDTDVPIDWSDRNDYFVYECVCRRRNSLSDRKELSFKRIHRDGNWTEDSLLLVPLEKSDRLEGLETCAESSAS